MRHILPPPSFLENFTLSWPTFRDTFESVEIPKGSLNNKIVKDTIYFNPSFQHAQYQKVNLLITFHFFVCQEKWNKMFLIKLRGGSLVQSRRLDIRLWKSFTILSPFLAFFHASKGKKGGKLFAAFTPKNFDV